MGKSDVRGVVQVVLCEHLPKPTRREKLHVEQTKIMLGGGEKFLKYRLGPTFYNFIFTFPELTFHDISLAPHKNIDISAK